ncbi:MAG: sugar phosphate nucleotidyltransferase [Verrucomicrobiae bacterium]|nr:sugar phosphate nucleotidyltransferase [Verrucomicrobiae bacterium]
MTSRNSSLKKAVVLAAGRGTRMGSLTGDLPKPMIPVAGQPILERIVGALREAGIRQFLLVTGYRAEVIESHFGDGARWGVEISYFRQTVQDGTGRAVHLAREFAGNDSFLLACGDILVASSTYQRLAGQWASADWDAILTVKIGEDLKHGGLLVFDRDFFLQELAEKPNDAEIHALKRRFGDIKPWYNAAVYVFKPGIFDYTARLRTSPRGEYELTEALRQMAHDGLRLKGQVIEDLWIDVRDPAALEHANRLLGANHTPTGSLAANRNSCCDKQL